MHHLFQKILIKMKSYKKIALDNISINSILFSLPVKDVIQYEASPLNYQSLSGGLRS